MSTSRLSGARFATALPETETDGVETAILIKEALDLLPHDMQEILLLRYVNDLSMKEISIITGISRFAIRRKINGALSQLKQILRKEDFL
jgi:RNA polymerase sigma-70 factor (ECF subfamily)